jgi:hypothetical protein
MKRNWVARGVKFAVFAVVFVAVFGFVVMSLWNALIPALFGGHVITFWQAVGLLVLSKILFGGFHGGPGRHLHWRHRMKERWENMTPEEREKVRQGFGGHCGPFGSRSKESKVEVSG